MTKFEIYPSGLLVPISPPTPEEAEPDDDECPEYTGPKGKQPDGSFILTPRCFEALRGVIAWQGARDRNAEQLHRFTEFLYTDTETDFEVLC